MSRPDWCPQEVWDVVLGLTPTPPFSNESVVVNNLRVETACAILAAKAEEREACAAVADDMWGDGPHAHYDSGATSDGWNIATRDIAAAIRKRGEA